MQDERMVSDDDGNESFVEAFCFDYFGVSMTVEAPATLEKLFSEAVQRVVNLEHKKWMRKFLEETGRRDVNGNIMREGQTNNGRRFGVSEKESDARENFKMCVEDSGSLDSKVMLNLYRFIK